MRTIFLECPDGAATPKGRIVQLDGLRACAFFSVFLWHAARIPDKMVLWAGVDLFYVLSGFLITGILLGARKQPLSGYFGHFYARRAIRILPPYAIAVLFAAALFPVGFRDAWGWYLSFSSNVGQALGANIPAPMTTFWSLAVEEQFYLLWPIVVAACSVPLLWRIAWAAILTAPLLRVLCSPWLSVSGGIFLLTPFRLDLLLAGSVLSIIWRGNSRIITGNGKFGVYAMAGSLAVYYALCFIPSFVRDSGSRLFDGAGYSLILVFVTGVLAYTLSLSPGDRAYKLLTFRPVAYLGRISYMMYLLHSTCIMICVRYLNGYGRLPARFTALLMTVALSSLSWHLIEKPLLNRGQRAQAREFPSKSSAAIAG